MNIKKGICGGISLLLILCLAFGVAPAVLAEDGQQFSQSAIDFVRDITAGWNLGNTFESCDSAGQRPWPEDNADLTPEFAETNWWNPVTTQEMFDKVAQTGFNAVRIPATWYKFTIQDEDGNYTVRQDWIDRIQEVVSYAQKHDMYVVVNMHHDDKQWLDLAATGETWDAMVEKYTQIWACIADAFKDYDEKLILEAGNEMLGDNDWWGHQEYYFEHQNQLYQAFHEVVRNSGGNNDKRYLMFPTYGAQWYAHQYEKVWIPENDDHVIYDIHWYSGNTDTAEYHSYFSAISDYFTRKGVAVLMGECGLNKNVPSATKAAWAKAYFGTAASYGLKCFIWDDGGNMQVLDRRKLSWVDDNMMQVIINTAKEEYVPVSTTERTTVDPSETTKPSVSFPNHETPVRLSGGWGAEGLSNPYYRGIANIAESSGSVSANGQIYMDMQNFETLYNQAVEAGVDEISYDVYIDFTEGEGATIKADLGNGTHLNDDKSLVHYEGGVCTISYPLETWVPEGKSAADVKAFHVCLMAYTYGPYSGTVYVSAPYIETGATPTESTASSTEPADDETPYGDLNGDQAINSRDSLLLRQFVANYAVQINEAAADVYKNGKIDLKDSLLLRQYIAKYDVQLGRPMDA